MEIVECGELLDHTENSKRQNERFRKGKWSEKERGTSDFLFVKYPPNKATPRDSKRTQQIYNKQVKRYPVL